MDASVLSCCTLSYVDKQSVEWSFNCPCVPPARENRLTPSVWGLVVMTKPISMLSCKAQKEFNFSIAVFCVCGGVLMNEIFRFISTTFVGAAVCVPKKPKQCLIQM